MTGIIIQARLGSTRLPNKMALPFYESKGVLEIIIEKISALYKNIPILIATSTNDKDDEIETLCVKHKTQCYRGSEENVLKRFVDAAQENNIDKIIRVCADNPFLDTNSLKNLIDDFEKEDCDYISFRTSDKIPSIKTHYGFWAEGVTLRALKKTAKETEDPFYHEHVTNYIYQNPEKFKIKWKPVNPLIEVHKNIRMTMDTEEDFLLLKEIYSAFVSQPHQSTEALVEFVADNENWTNKMQKQILRNTK